MNISTKKILLAVVLALIAFSISQTILNQTQSSLIAIITLLITLWSNEAIPLAITSLLPIILFPAFDILSTKATTTNYAHPIIYLFLGGFMIAVGVEKIHLHKFIANKILNLFSNTPRAIIFALTLTSGLLSAILSNTTTTLLLISIALFITQNKALKMRFALGVAYGASIGGILTPIGTPPNLILLGIMQEKGLEAIPFFQWMWMVAPLSFIMLFIVSFLLSLGIENTPIQREKENLKLNHEQKKLLYLLGGLVTLLLVNAPIKPFYSGLGLSESGILLGFGLLLFTPPFQILEWEADSKKIPFKIMFLFGAGFSIAKAFGTTGLADIFASYLLVITQLEPIYILFSVAFLITFTTEITSNTALISIMLPVIYSVAQQSGIDTTLFMMVATLCASYAFMLPIATAPNAIAMSSGAVSIANMVRYGIVLNLVGIFLIVMIAQYFWKGIL